MAMGHKLQQRRHREVRRPHEDQSERHVVNNPSDFSLLVMAGHSSLLYADYVNLSALPAIHVLSIGKKDVAARHKAGHDG
jgi:hypothetical protein